MKKPRRITIVPAHSMVQLGSTGTGRSWAVQLSADKSTYTVPIASHEARFRYLDTEQGSPEGQLAKLKKQTSKWAATHAYNQRVKQRGSKSKAQVSKAPIQAETATHEVETMSRAGARQKGESALIALLANSSGKINLKS